MVVLAFQTTWPAHHLHSPIFAVSEVDRLRTGIWWVGQVDLEVAGNEKVQPPVAVIIPECRAGRPSPNGHARLFGDVGERAVMVVVIEAVLPEIGHVEVGPAVVVVVGNCASHPPSPVCDTRAFGYICKCSIMIVMKQSCARRLGLARKRIISRAVHQVDIEPAVVVVVDQAHARPLRLQD